MFVRVRPLPVAPPSRANPAVAAVAEEAQAVGSNGAEAGGPTCASYCEESRKTRDDRERTLTKPQRRQSRDFYKPQYIAFANPLLVKLFSKMAMGLKKFEVIMEERLPGRDGLLQHEGAAYATEFILQCDFPDTCNNQPTTDDLERHAERV